MVNCQNSRDKGPPECNSARGWAQALFHNKAKYAFHTQSLINPLDPSLLGITASPTELPGAVDPIGDIIIDHILPFKDSTQLT